MSLPTITQNILALFFPSTSHAAATETHELHRQLYKMKKTKPSPKSHLKANQIKRKTAWKRSPICEGVRPFLASLIICSSTSSLDNFSQLGTERRYGRDDWEIPFLRERKETGKDQEEVGNEPKFSTTCLSSSPGYSRGGSPPPEKSGKQRHFSGSCGLNTDPDSSRSYPTAS